MRPLSKGWRRLFIVGLLGVVAALVAFCLPRERLLLKRATRVARLDTRKNWLGAYSNDYYWLDSQDVLLFHFHKGYIRLNLRTSQETLLPTLTRLSTGFDRMDDRDYVSRDGRWLLWKSRREVEVATAGATVDGAHSFNTQKMPDTVVTGWRWPFGYPKDICWLSDSHHWAELVGAYNSKFTGVRVHSVDAPRSVQVLRFPSPLFLAWKSDLVIAPQAHMIALTPYAQTNNRPFDYSAATISEFDLYGPIRLLRAFPVYGPKDMSFSEAALSPQGDHIAWLQEIAPAPPAIFFWLHRLFSRLKVPQQRIEALYVSRLDGSQMCEIGHIAMEPGDAETPYQVRWMPDGKRLSFLYKGTLYTVPAD